MISSPTQKSRIIVRMHFTRSASGCGWWIITNVRVVDVRIYRAEALLRWIVPTFVQYDILLWNGLIQLSCAKMQYWHWLFRCATQFKRVCMGCLIFSGFANIWICVMERLDRSPTCSTPEQNVGGSCSCKSRFLHFFQPGSKKDMRGSGESTRAVDEKRWCGISWGEWKYAFPFASKLYRHNMSPLCTQLEYTLIFFPLHPAALLWIKMFDAWRVRYHIVLALPILVEYSLDVDECYIYLLTPNK